MKLWRPGTKRLVCMVLVTIGALIYVLGINPHTKILCYIVYAFSTYTLIVSCIALPDFGRWVGRLIAEDKIPPIAAGRHLLERNRFAARYLADSDFRAGVALYTGFAWNLFYALFKGIAGLVYSSVWMVAIGIYYLVLGGIRMHLLKNNRSYVSQEEGVQRRMAAYRTYRSTGALLLLLDIAMSGILIQMIRDNKSYSYPGLIIYVSALYTFYYFITALISVVKFAKRTNPILSAAKNIALAGAGMSVLALQTAMITSFGGGGEEAFRFRMNCATGTVVLAFVIGMALFMIWRGTARLADLQKENDLE